MAEENEGLRGRHWFECLCSTSMKGEQSQEKGVKEAAGKPSGWSTRVVVATEKDAAYRLVLPFGVVHVEHHARTCSGSDGRGEGLSPRVRAGGQKEGEKSACFVHHFSCATTPLPLSLSCTPCMAATFRSWRLRCNHQRLCQSKSTSDRSLSFSLPLPLFVPPLGVVYPSPSYPLPMYV